MTIITALRSPVTCYRVFGLMRILLLLCLSIYAWDSYHSCNCLCKSPNNVVVYKSKLLRPPSKKSVILDFEFLLTNYLTIFFSVCGTIILLWNLLLFVSYNFVFIPFNHDLSLGSRRNHGFKQAKIFADIVLYIHAIIFFIFVLEVPISLTYYLFHIDFEVPILRLNRFKFRSTVFKISIFFFIPNHFSISN